jgi:hypothetical protein
MTTNVERGQPLVVRFTLAQRCERDSLNIEDTNETWGIGRVCIHCARPVAVRVQHYGSALPGYANGGTGR